MTTIHYDEAGWQLGQLLGRTHNGAHIIYIGDGRAVFYDPILPLTVRFRPFTTIWVPDPVPPDPYSTWEASGLNLDTLATN